jgi:hypothetical protein
MREKGKHVMPADRRTTTRKTMRVATLFTGAATAAIGFTQAATAAPGQAGTAKTTEVPTRPNIQTTSNCFTSATKHWVHIEYWNANKFCAGFAGYLSWRPPRSLTRVQECGGTNRGVISLTNGKLSNFYPGTTYRRFAADVSGLTIISWSGTDACNAFPPQY